MMRVLVACEYSGVVRDAFRAKGHAAWSCDLLASDSKYHIQDDVLKYLYGWDLMIAHPPCTHLSSSGARHWKNKQDVQIEAIEFVKQLMNANIDKICVENPIGILSTKIGKPTQIVHPYYFGDPVSKATCLWLKNLEPLKPTYIVEPEYITLNSGRRYSKWHYETSLEDHKLRGHIRSKTFEGIAKAMADQWG